MTKLQYKDIKSVYEGEDLQLKSGLISAEEVAKIKNIPGPSGYTVGYFTPSQANWSYNKEIIQFAGNMYEVVTVFGWARAVRKIYVSDQAERVRVGE